VHGYQHNAPIDPSFIVANVHAAALEMKFKNAGRKQQFDHDTVLQEIKNIDPYARQSIRSLAGAIGIPRCTIGRMKQGEKMRVYSMSLKPKLNIANIVNRLYCSIFKIDKN
jgi:hypothetical protein